MKRVICIFLALIMLIGVVGCSKLNNSQSSISTEQNLPTISSNVENSTEYTTSKSESIEEVKRLNDYITIDVGNVTYFEHSIIYNGSTTVEYVTEFTQQNAKDMAQQLSQFAVDNQGNISDYTSVGGNIVKYTLTFLNSDTPLVIYYSTTFSKDSIDNAPVCYINREYYEDTVFSPNIVDIVFPENTKTKIYDVIDGQRVEQTK
ncbi:MAG: hypothetical protein RR622_07485 [Hydrogenoanaerobacterium sp.]